jgi:hypothetical protein
MRERLIKTAAILIAILGFATVQMRAEIPIVQADTVFQGFGGGSVSGIVFGPTGETVIVIHNAQPIEINIKTKQIVREFEKVPNSPGSQPLSFIDRARNYLGGTFYSTDYFGEPQISGGIIWDINTGKIIKKLPHITLLSDGIKYYSYIIKNNKEYVGLFDINQFKFIDSVEFDQYWYNGEPGRTSAGFGIIPNSNKVLIGTNGPNYHRGRSKLYVLDFDTKQYTEIPIPFEPEQDSSEITSIKVSETGKYFVVTLDYLKNDQTGYFFYDKDFKFVYKETLKHLTEIWNDPDKFVSYWVPTFIHDDYLIAGADYYNPIQKKHYQYTDYYDIAKALAIKRIDFYPSANINYFNDKVGISNRLGSTILLSEIALRVDENKISYLEKTAEYLNGNLTFNSEIAEKANIEIIDYKGNILYSKKEIYLTTGKNSFAIDFPMSYGIYFAIVKTTHCDFSYKFIVSR